MQLSNELVEKALDEVLERISWIDVHAGDFNSDHPADYEMKGSCTKCVAGVLTEVLNQMLNDGG